MKYSNIFFRKIQRLVLLSIIIHNSVYQLNTDIVIGILYTTDSSEYVAYWKAVAEVIKENSNLFMGQPGHFDIQKFLHSLAEKLKLE